MGTVAGAHLRGVSTQVQRVRRAGAPGWVHHKAVDDGADSAHVGEPTSAPAMAPARSPLLEMKNGQELAAPEAVFVAIPDLEFDQKANLTAAAMYHRMGHVAGVDAEPMPELEFDQRLGW